MKYRYYQHKREPKVCAIRLRNDGGVKSMAKYPDLACAVLLSEQFKVYTPSCISFDRLQTEYVKTTRDNALEIGGERFADLVTNWNLQFRRWSGHGCVVVLRTYLNQPLVEPGTDEILTLFPGNAEDEMKCLTISRKTILENPVCSVKTAFELNRKFTQAVTEKLGPFLP
jgi:hypothetical protein